MAVGAYVSELCAPQEAPTTPLRVERHRRLYLDPIRAIANAASVGWRGLRKKESTRLRGAAQRINTCVYNVVCCIVHIIFRSPVRRIKHTR